jgi:hypothetical protein
MNLITAITMKPGTRYPYYPSTFGPKQPNTVAPIDGGEGEESMTIYPGIEPLKKKSTTKHSFTIPYTTTQKYGSTTEEPVCQ